MSEFLDSGVFVPLQEEAGEPQETGLVLGDQEMHGTDARSLQSDVGDASSAGIYAGPELVLPQPDEITPTKMHAELLESSAATAGSDLSIVPMWRERVRRYAQRMAVVATLGSVLAGATACSGEADNHSGSAQHGGASSAPAPSTATGPGMSDPRVSIGSVTYPCTFKGQSEMPSTDSRVRSGTSIDERAVAKLLGTTTGDIAKCDAPRLGEGLPRSAALLTGVEYLQKSTGDRVVVTVTTDTVDPDTGRPNTIDVYFKSPNGSIDMGYDEYNGAFTCLPAPDDLNRIAECDAVMTMKKDPRRDDQYYALSIGLYENSTTKNGLGHMGKTIIETAGDRVHKVNSLLGSNMSSTIGPPEVG